MLLHHHMRKTQIMHSSSKMLKQQVSIYLPLHVNHVQMALSSTSASYLSI